MNSLKDSILAGTVALATGCSSISDLITFGSSDQWIPDDPAALITYQREAQDARELGRTIASGVISEAHTSMAYTLARESPPYAFVLQDCLVQLGVEKQALGQYLSLRAGRWAAFDIERYAMRFALDAYGPGSSQRFAQNIKEAAGPVRETAQQVAREICGDNCTDSGQPLNFEDVQKVLFFFVVIFPLFPFYALDTP